MALETWRNLNNLKKSLLSVSVALLGGALTSCATSEPSSSGILQRDSNTYFISVQTSPVFGKGSPESRRVAYQDAIAHCKQHGKNMRIVDERSGPATVNLTFECTGSDNQGTNQGN